MEQIMGTTKPIRFLCILSTAIVVSSCASIDKANNCDSSQNDTSEIVVETETQKVAYKQIDFIADALDQYSVSNGRFPLTKEGLTGLVQQKFLKSEVELYDPWGHRYRYKSTGYFGWTISSLGSDNKKCGKDDAADFEVNLIIN